MRPWVVPPSLCCCSQAVVLVDNGNPEGELVRALRAAGVPAERVVVVSADTIAPDSATVTAKSSSEDPDEL